MQFIGEFFRVAGPHDYPPCVRSLAEFPPRVFALIARDIDPTKFARNVISERNYQVGPYTGALLLQCVVGSLCSHARQIPDGFSHLLIESNLYPAFLGSA